MRDAHKIQSTAADAHDARVVVYKARMHWAADAADALELFGDAGVSPQPVECQHPSEVDADDARARWAADAGDARARLHEAKCQTAADADDPEHFCG